MKKNRKRNKGLSARRGIYILPNLFTSASLFGGFYAIIASIEGRFEAAAVAIIISAIFDGLDGRIARITHTTSDFGCEYDSLADLVSFGVAPAILAYTWALKPFGRLGWLAAFMFAICGALRLARFNVEIKEIRGSYFKGLPIPSAACLIASLILFTAAVPVIAEKRSVFIILMMYTLSYLMVSSFKYMSFKEINIKRQKQFNQLVAVILVLSILAYKPRVLLFPILLVYVLSGPAVSVFLYIKSASDNKLSGPVDSQSEESEAIDS